MTNVTKKIALNASFLAIDDIVLKALSLVSLPIMMRYLGVDTFGMYVFAQSFASIILVVSDVGLKTTLVRDVAKNKERAGEYVHNSMILKSIFFVIAFMITLGIVDGLGYFSEKASLIYLVMVSGITASFTVLLSSFFKAFEVMHTKALVDIAGGLISLIAVIAVLVLLRGGIYELLAAFVVGNLLIAAWSYRLVKAKIAETASWHHNWKVDWGAIKSLFMLSIPVGISGIFVMVYNYFDIVMLEWMRGDYEVGVYGAAYKLIITLHFIPYAIVGALFPVMSRLSKSSPIELKFIFERSFKYLALLGLPIAVGVTFTADEIMILLGGENWAEAGTALKILIWATFIAFLNYPIGALVITLDRQKVAAFNAGVCMVVNIGLNFLLIPSMGFKGASIATVATEALLFMMGYIALSRALYSPPVLSLSAKPTVCGVGLAVVLYLLGNIGLFLSVLASIAAYTGFLLLTRIFDERDRDMFLDLLPGQLEWRARN